MDLKESIEILNKFKNNYIERDKLEINPRGELKIGKIYKKIELDKAIDTVLKELDNRISKELLEEYLTQAEERYKTYKKASEENEDCKGGMWRYLGQVDLLKRILGKSINIATLDKE